MQLVTVLRNAWKGRQNEEHHKVPKFNWMQVFFFQMTISVIASVMAPSMYQFITSPFTPPLELEQNSTRFWPGLGGADLDYAWAHTISPIVEFSVFPLALWMTQYAPYTIPFFISSVTLLIAGVLYALAPSTQMFFISRGLIGMGGGLMIPAIHTYMGETGSVMDKIRESQGKPPRKCFIYIAFSFILNGGFIIGFVFTSVMAQFDSINPYRWPGWLIVAFSGLQILIILFFFTETRSFTKIRVTPLRLRSVKSHLQFSGFQWKTILPCIFLIGCGYTSGQLYQLLLALVTPILSDQFGFNVEYTSHFLIGLSLAFFFSSFIQLVLKLADVDNRKVLGLLLLVAIAGTLLLADWQSIGGNPCSNYTTSHNEPQFLSLTELNINSTGNEITFPGDNTTTTTTEKHFTYLTHHDKEICEALSSDCFWNPHSRITHEDCNTCLPVCLSRTKSLCFYQFSLGVLLVSIASPLLFVFSSAISSDIMPVKSQWLRATS